MRCVDCNRETSNGVICSDCDLDFDIRDCEKQIVKQQQFKMDMEAKKLTDCKHIPETIDEVIADTVDELEYLYKQLDNLLQSKELHK